MTRPDVMYWFGYFFFLFLFLDHWFLQASIPFRYLERQDGIMGEIEAASSLSLVETNMSDVENKI